MEETRQHPAVSRRRREQRLEAEESWPRLTNLFVSYLHENYRAFYSSKEAAIDAAVAEHSLEYRQQLLREWRDWNGRCGWKGDVHRFLWDGFGIYYTFDTAVEARQFMNSVYEKLIGSVREETEQRWKP